MRDCDLGHHVACLQRAELSQLPTLLVRLFPAPASAQPALVVLGEYRQQVSIAIAAPTLAQAAKQVANAAGLESTQRAGYDFIGGANVVARAAPTASSPCSARAPADLDLQAVNTASLVAFLDTFANAKVADPAVTGAVSVAARRVDPCALVHHVVGFAGGKFALVGGALRILERQPGQPVELPDTPRRDIETCEDNDRVVTFGCHPLGELEVIGVARHSMRDVRYALIRHRQRAGERSRAFVVRRGSHLGAESLEVGRIDEAGIASGDGRLIVGWAR